jgi:thioredoxin reductase
MTVDVLIVGAGPAGLAAAIELRRLGVDRVLVADRESEAGGVTRHCVHTGFGVRDLHRVLTGPGYARRYVQTALSAGAELRCGITVTELSKARQPVLTGTGLTNAVLTSAVLTSAGGIERVSARAVLLATGCRERPRPARLIPGDRPSGIMTTGELQQRVYLHGERLPGRALIAGAEHVSFSAVMTLAHAGADVIALVTDQPRHQSFPAFRLGVLARWQLPVWTSTAVSRIIGRERLAAVELTDLDTGAVRPVGCDTLVLTGDWIPDHELARRTGLAIDRGTKGPAIDTAGNTSMPGIFAAGNLVHAAETADVAALSGRHAARQIAAALAGEFSHEQHSRSVPVEVASPLAWISPNGVSPDRTVPSRNYFVLRSEGPRHPANLEVRQNSELLARARTTLAPARSITLNADWVGRVDPDGGPVSVTAS